MSRTAGYEILQSTVPEAMVITDSSEKNILHTLPDLSVYKAVGIGPGLSTQAETSSVLEKILKAFKKAVVLDADALNILSQHAHFFKLIPPYSILTPHPKEFDRVFGQHVNEFDRIQTARKVSREKQVIIVLKGHYTFIAMPGGKGYFNTSGNAGMAKGGSGDALTGILTSLLAQGYLPGEAALLGVFLHGLAGDLALKDQSMESLLPTDLIENIGNSFKLLQS
jgi:NAD(P)H-hydrate epimerase